MPRLDQMLVARGLCESREKAQRSILAGQVRVNDQPARKPSDAVRETDRLAVEGPPKYVSRGGFKLEHALREFQVRTEGIIAADLGASTGGFTDCLLQRGAIKVYAIDVGGGQLAWKLRQDHRVVVMEKTNARQLTRGHFPAPFQPLDLVVIDCSFISLRKLLAAAAQLLKPSASILALIKPQFEAGKTEVDRGEGVIRDAAIHDRVIAEIRQCVEELPSLRWLGTVPSPLLGPAGNREFFALIQNIVSS